MSVPKKSGRRGFEKVSPDRLIDKTSSRKKKSKQWQEILGSHRKIFWVNPFGLTQKFKDQFMTMEHGYKGIHEEERFYENL